MWLSPPPRVYGGCLRVREGETKRIWCCLFYSPVLGQNPDGWERCYRPKINGCFLKGMGNQLIKIPSVGECGGLSFTVEPQQDLVWMGAEGAGWTPLAVEGILQGSPEVSFVNSRPLWGDQAWRIWMCWPWAWETALETSRDVWDVSGEWALWLGWAMKLERWC